jgi:N-acetylmuramoyl-L-alanine amidase
MNRKIKFIVLHCTATQPEATVKAIQNYWCETLKWNNPGYHFIIERDGEVIQLQHIEKIANGVAGNNEHAIHISYIGGIDRKGKPIDNRTTPQKDSMFDKVVELTERYPDAKVVGHRDFPGVRKACPSFDVRAWIESYEPDVKKNAA